MSSYSHREWTDTPQFNNRPSYFAYRPSNLTERKRVYSVLPNVKVKPLRIAESDLDVSRILTLMGADDLEVCAIVAS